MKNPHVSTTLQRTHKGKNDVFEQHIPVVHDIQIRMLSFRLTFNKFLVIKKLRNNSWPFDGLIL